ncbi:MAG: hypothetical protein ACKO6N_14595 [Myxococcota bacterium]
MTSAPQQLEPFYPDGYTVEGVQPLLLPSEALFPPAQHTVERPALQQAPKQGLGIFGSLVLGMAVLALVYMGARLLGLPVPQLRVTSQGVSVEPLLDDPQSGAELSAGERPSSPSDVAGDAGGPAQAAATDGRSSAGPSQSPADSDASPARAPSSPTGVASASARSNKSGGASSERSPAAPVLEVGYLVVKAIPTAAVRVDGKPYGSSDTRQRIKLSAGKHVVTLTPAQGRSVERAFTLKPGETRQLEYDFMERAWRVTQGAPR